MLLWLTKGLLLAQLVNQPAITTSMDSERVPIGASITIRIVLTNTGSTPLTAVGIDSRLSAGLAFQPGSATTPTGTSFTRPATPADGVVGTWTVGRIEPREVITFTFRASVTNIGVVYHTATVQGLAAQACATVPVLVCTGDQYAFDLTAPANDGNYRWERTLDGQTVVLPAPPGNTLTVSSPGAYRAVRNNTQPCTDGACCPFVIDPVADVPAYTLSGRSPTCSGTAPLPTGTLRLTGPASTTALTFQLALGGSTFETGNLLTPNRQSIPPTGLLSISLIAGTYRVRVYNAAGCFRDQTVTIAPANCNCPPEKCVPFVLRQTRKSPVVVR